MTTNTNAQATPTQVKPNSTLLSLLDIYGNEVMTGDVNTIMAAYAAAEFKGRIVQVAASSTPALAPSTTDSVIASTQPKEGTIPAPAAPGGHDQHATFSPGSVTMTGDSGTVSEVARLRIETQEADMAKARDVVARAYGASVAGGLVQKAPLFAPGTRVIGMGVDNWKASYKAWADSPETSVACDTIAEAVASEGRRDIECHATDLRMADDGSITVGTGGAREAFKLEERGLWQLCSGLRLVKGDDVNSSLRDDGPSSRPWFQSLGSDDESIKLFPRAFDFMRTCSAEERAYNFNNRIKRVDIAQKVKLRTRTLANDGSPSIFAMVSQKYTPVDIDKVAAAIARAMDGAGTRGNVVYNPSAVSLKVDAMWHQDKVVDLAAGDTFKVGLQFRAGDGGTGGINGGLIAFRNLCLNLIILDTAKAQLFAFRHMSIDPEAITMAVQKAADVATEAFAGFASQWSFLRQAEIKSVKLWGEDFATVPDAIEYMVAEGKIKAAIGRDILAQHLLDGYKFEPGTSLADLVNAITRSAHASSVRAEVQEQLEVEAGRLVPVLVKAAQSSKPLALAMP